MIEKPAKFYTFIIVLVCARKTFFVAQCSEDLSGVFGKVFQIVDKS